MRIGDKVSGNFRNVHSEQVPFVGIISSGDTGGGLNIEFEAPVEFRAGDPRMGAYFDARERMIADIVVIQEQAVPCDNATVFQGHIVRSGR